MSKIKKNDVVYVLAGRDKGKTGKVFRMMPGAGKALVEGINYVKKHVRKAKADQQGGIVQMESAISLSNIALFCKSCNKASRAGINILADGSRSRFCKRCKEVV